MKSFFSGKSKASATYIVSNYLENSSLFDKNPIFFRLPKEQDLFKNLHSMSQSGSEDGSMHSSMSSFYSSSNSISISESESSYGIPTIMQEAEDETVLRYVLTEYLCVFITANCKESKLKKLESKFEEIKNKKENKLTKEEIVKIVMEFWRSKDLEKIIEK